MKDAQIVNLDIAVAVAQIVQADAQVGISGAPLLPTVTGNASAEREHFGSQSGSTGLNGTGLGSGGSSNFSQFNASLTASYMIGFWGKNRATLYSAEESATVSRYNREVVTLTTLVTVANTYFQVLAAQDELRVEARRAAPGRAAPPPLEVTLRQNIAALALLEARAPANFNIAGGALTSIAVP